MFIGGKYKGPDHSSFFRGLWYSGHQKQDMMVPISLPCSVIGVFGGIFFEGQAISFPIMNLILLFNMGPFPIVNG